MTSLFQFPRTLTMPCANSPCGAHRAPVTEAATTFAPAASAPVTRSAWRLERSNPSSALEKEERTSKASQQSEAFWRRVQSCVATSSILERFHSDSTPRVGIAFRVSRLGIPIRKKRLTMALQRTAPRVTVAAILIRVSLVRATLFRSSYALSSLHPRSYRAALRSL